MRKEQTPVAAASVVASDSFPPTFSCQSCTRLWQSRRSEVESSPNSIPSRA